MTRLNVAALVAGCAIAFATPNFAADTASSTTPLASCESKAVSKEGKPLAGAARNSFLKKCLADTCAATAVSKDGKPLSGAAKNSYMQKCEKTS